VRWKLAVAVREPLEQLCAGFHEMLPAAELVSFDAGELELLTNGSAEVSVKDLRRQARYANGFSERSKPVLYFWTVFAAAEPAEQGRILSFISGSPRMPLDDLSIQIVRSDEGPEQLPSSHTCFHQLVLPVYESQQQLRDKLTQALDNAQGFFLT
jgi:hypothetical protein